MKKNYCIFLLALFVLAACSKNYGNQILGRWKFVQQIEQDFFEDEFDLSSSQGSLIIEQKIIYEFNSDGTYSKNVEQKIIDSKKGESEEYYEVLKSYVGSSVEFCIHGDFKASSKKLFLNAKTIDINGQTLNYADYQTLNKDIGLQNSSRLYKLNEKSLTIYSLESQKDEEFFRLDS